MAGPGGAALSVGGLVKRYGGVRAVDGIDFTIPPGLLATFLGPSGCGKTTTLRMVAGLETPDGGLIELGGECLFRVGAAGVPPERRRIGMVFQSYAVWPHMTVAENVAFPLRVRRLPRAEAESRVAEALRLVRMEHLASRYPAQLSGGQQQRVALARAIVFEPRLLLLDEPLSNLDAALREEMRFEIRALQQRLGMTALFVTHDQDEALALSDLLAVMRDGRILQWGAPREVYERPVSPFVADFVGWKIRLRGRVIEGGRVVVGGTQLALPVPQPPGAEVDLCLRPQALSVRPAGPEEPLGPREIRGRIVASLYRATRSDLEIELAGGLVTAEVPATAVFSPDQPVAVGLDAERLLVFPAESA